MGRRRRIKSFHELAEVLQKPPADHEHGAARQATRVPTAGADGYTVGRWPARGAVAVLPPDNSNRVFLLIDRGPVREVKTIVEHHAAVLPELAIVTDQERQIAIARVEEHRLLQRAIDAPRPPLQVSPPAPQVAPAPSSRPPTPLEATGPVDVEIRGECERRGITTVVHFTDDRNLESILRHGLLSVRSLETRGDAFFRSDTARWDERLDAICLSIEFPNWQMFHSKRQEEGRQWAVLGIESRILWELDCAFLPDNAARAQLRRSRLHRGAEAFRALFSDVEDHTRADLGIRDCDPTNPQSEVLCFQSIPPGYIQFIHVDSPYILDWFRYQEVCTPVRPSLETKYFRPRADWQHWSKSAAEPPSRTASQPTLLIDEDLPF